MDNFNAETIHNIYEENLDADILEIKLARKFFMHLKTKIIEKANNGENKIIISYKEFNSFFNEKYDLNIFYAIMNNRLYYLFKHLNFTVNINTVTSKESKTKEKIYIIRW